jgi:hypothetical protein
MGGWLRKAKQKQFFFEKKNQKTFAIDWCASIAGWWLG